MMTSINKRAERSEILEYQARRQRLMRQRKLQDEPTPRGMIGCLIVASLIVITLSYLIAETV